MNNIYHWNYCVLHPFRLKFYSDSAENLSLDIKFKKILCTCRIKPSWACAKFVWLRATANAPHVVRGLVRLLALKVWQLAIAESVGKVSERQVMKSAERWIKSQGCHPLHKTWHSFYAICLFLRPLRVVTKKEREQLLKEVENLMNMYTILQHNRSYST